MNFEFSEEQNLLREQVRRVLTQHCARDVVRSVFEGRRAFAVAAQAELARMGVWGAAVPERYGGCSGDPLLLCILAEEVGRALAPLPTFGTVYTAAAALMAAHEPEQMAEWLERIAGGDATGCFAPTDPCTLDGHRCSTVEFRNGRVSGDMALVLGAAVAQFAVVLAHDGTTDLLVMVALDTADASVRPAHSVDPLLSFADLRFRDAAAVVLRTDGRAAAHEILDKAAVYTAFEQLGAAERCLEMACEYAKSRHAFGRPIGAFQAIKHKLVDMYVGNALARAHAYYGAWALGAQTELPLAAAAARASAGDALSYAAQECMHIHGGLGHTWEHDCHLFYRRARSLELALGGPRYWKERIVQMLESEDQS